MVNDRGLQFDLDVNHEAERCSALPSAAPDPGNIVFIYRNKVPAATAIPGRDRPIFRKVAA
jgi:hypothetical protein